MRAAFAERRRADPAFTFASDGVHPGDLGHRRMARIVAGGLSLHRPADTLETELTRIQADPLEQKDSAAARPELVSEHTAMINAWRKLL